MSDRVSNVRRKELEQPDPFLESMYKALDTVKRLKKQLILGGGIVVAIICIVSATVYTIHSAEVKASEILTDAIKAYGNQKPTEGYELVKDKFTTLLNEYSNTSSGRVGTVKFADICYAAEKYDMAYNYYIAALEEFKEDPVMQNIILSSLGHTCQVLKKDQEAEKYFKAITEGKSELLKEDALFNLGLAAIANGESQKGIDLLKKLSSGYQTSMYKPMADEIIAKN